jgi:hypothetical protein
VIVVLASSRGAWVDKVDGPGMAELSLTSTDVNDGVAVVNLADPEVASNAHPRLASFRADHCPGAASGPHLPGGKEGADI